MNKVAAVPEVSWYHRARGNYATTVAFAVTCYALLLAGRTSLPERNDEDFLRTFSAAREQVAAECSPSGRERAAFILLMIFCFPAAIALAVISGLRLRWTCGVLMDKAKASTDAKVFFAECKMLFSGWKVADEDMPCYMERKARLIRAAEAETAEPTVIPKSPRELLKITTDKELVFEDSNRLDSALWQSLFAAANVEIAADANGNSAGSQVSILAKNLSSAEAGAMVSLGLLEEKMKFCGCPTSLRTIGAGPSAGQLQLLLRQILAWKAILAAKSELNEQQSLAEGTLSFRISNTIMLQMARLRSDPSESFFSVDYFFHNAFASSWHKQKENSGSKRLQEALKEVQGKGNFVGGVPDLSFEMCRDMAYDLSHILFRTELFPHGSHSHVPWKDFCLREPVYGESGSCTLNALIKAAGMNFLSPKEKIWPATDAKPIPAKTAKNLIDCVNAFRMDLLSALEDLEIKAADGWRPIWDEYKEVCGKTVAGARRDLSARIAELEALLPPG